MTETDFQNGMRERMTRVETKLESLHHEVELGFKDVRRILHERRDRDSSRGIVGNIALGVALVASVAAVLGVIITAS